MLRVGIHENIVLSKVGRNEKGTLTLSFRPKRLEGRNTEVDEFSEEGIPVDHTTDDGASNLLLFCPNAPSFKEKDGSELSDARKADFIRSDFETFRGQLAQFLGAYTAVKDLKFTPYANTGITKENWQQEILNEDQRRKIYDNYIDQWLPMITPFCNDDSRAIRLKLVRQSKAKHYATIPSRYIQDNPFVEPMEVSAERSQLKFNKYEKENGLDSGEPIAQSEADPILEATDQATESVFGKR